MASANHVAGGPMPEMMIKDGIDPTSVKASTRRSTTSDARRSLHSPTLEVRALGGASVANTHTGVRDER